MAYTPTWHYDLSGNLTLDERLENVKATCYRLFVTYDYLNVATVLAFVAWMDYLSLDNPGYTDNGSYSNRDGRGLILFPKSWVETYAADLGLPWYNGSMQHGAFQYYARGNWHYSFYTSYDNWKNRHFTDNDVEHNTKNQIRALYGDFLYQFLINIPEASYGHDITVAFTNQLWSIAAHYWPYLDYWTRHGWADKPPAWLYFEMSKRKKGGGKLLL